MSALGTRAAVQERQHYYLTPLAQVGQVPEQMETWVQAALSGQVPLVNLLADDGPTVLAQAYELTRDQERPATEAQPRVTWTERVRIVHAESFAQAAQRGLAQRLQHAEAAIKTLAPPCGRGQRQFTAAAPLRAAVDAILDRYQV